MSISAATSASRVWVTSLASSAFASAALVAAVDSAGAGAGLAVVFLGGVVFAAGSAVGSVAVVRVLIVISSVPGFLAGRPFCPTSSTLPQLVQT